MRNLYEKKIITLNKNEFDYKVNIFDKSNLLLHRYRKINEYSLNDLLNEEITFVSPKLFNDPNDSTFINELNLKMNISYTVNQNNSEEEKGYIKGEAKLTEESKNKLDSKQQEIMKKKVRVACFSETYTNNAMWAHYGDLAKGVIFSYSYKQLEILMKENNIVDYVLAPVFYKNHKLSFNPFTDNIEKEFLEIYIKKAMLLKDIDWNYENEWRLIFPISYEKVDSKLYISLKNIKPEKIYLGENIASTNFDEIKKIAKEKNIKLYRMKTIVKSETRELSFDEVI